MMNGFFKGVQGRSCALKAAFAANRAAYDAYVTAENRYREQPTPHTAHALVNAEQSWSDNRDLIIMAAQALLTTATLYLLAFQSDEFPALRTQLASLRDGFAHEVETFKTYSGSIDDLSVAREAWEAARGEVISRAWPLIQTIEATSLPDESPPVISDQSGIDTDLDGTPSWQDAATPEERDRIIYENRKQTLGVKRAGQLTYAIPRAINKRRGQV